jgi:hypothetical protein
MSTEDIENLAKNLTDEEFASLIGSALYGSVRGLVDQGMSAQMALRLVAAQYVTAAIGPKALEDMGVPFSTARRWRLQLRRAAENIPDEPPQHILDDAQRYLEEKAGYFTPAADSSAPAPSAEGQEGPQ